MEQLSLLDQPSLRPQGIGGIPSKPSPDREGAVDTSYIEQSGQAAKDFDGSTYEPQRDRKRLNAQYIAVFATMKDGEWRTLKEISEITHASESSVSARLRDMRKEKNGSHTVDRRHISSGLFQYRLIIKQ